MEPIFKDEGSLLPAIIQDIDSNKILMLGYMNQESLSVTKRTGKATFFSRSRQKLWTKGETSGNFLDVKEIITDCDQDTILIKAIPSGPVCHTGADTCFSEENKKKFELKELEKIILERKVSPKKDSYTNQLFNSGINKIAQKVGEEAVELIIESKDQNEELFLNEAADLMYHFLVLLRAKNKSLADVEKILENRHK
jgi:phosphoribosyl-AMP cyclohydrolase / phosphoribosyl-ATP pyrophosphohydrolase